MIGNAVPLSRPAISRDDIDAVVGVLNTPTLSLGPNLTAFEHELAAYAGTRHGVGVNSGTSGLHVALAAAGVGAGDEVITSPFSFVASANCAIYLGARPVFADIDEATLGLDPATVEAAITERTRAIVPVDVFGQPCRIDDIVDIARRHGLAVVRDACEAIGAERAGVRVGVSTQGDATVFAFYPNKQMTTGEGGMVVTDDAEMAAAMRSMANQGRDDAGTWMNHVRLGYNYRLDEMSAALGRSQLARLDAILANRARVAAWYDERIAGIDGVSAPVVVPETTRMSWFVYVVRLDPSVDREALMTALAADGIPSRPYFVPIHLQPYYRERYGYGPGDFPVTERVAGSTLALPFFTEMTEDDVDRVCDRIVTRLAGSVRREGAGVHA